MSSANADRNAAPADSEIDFSKFVNGTTPGNIGATIDGPFYTEPAAAVKPLTYRCEPDMSLANSYRISRIQRSYHLTEALTHGGSQPLYCEMPSGEIGIIQSVQREDGSGRCFNVTLALWRTNEIVTRFIRFPKSAD